MTATAIIASDIDGLVIGQDDATGLPIKLKIGSNRIPEAAWRAWLIDNVHSHLIGDSLRRIEQCRR